MTKPISCIAAKHWYPHVFRNPETPEHERGTTHQDGILYASRIGQVHTEAAQALHTLRNTTPKTANGLSTGLAEQPPEQEQKIIDLENQTDLHRELKKLLAAIGKEVLSSATVATHVGKGWNGNNDQIYIYFQFQGQRYGLGLDNDWNGWDIQVTNAQGDKLYDEGDTGTLDTADHADAIREALAGGKIAILEQGTIQKTALQTNLAQLLKKLGTLSEATLIEGQWVGNNDYMKVEVVIGGKKYHLTLDNDLTSWDLELSDPEGTVLYTTGTIGDMGSLNITEHVQAMRNVLQGKPTETSPSTPSPAKTESNSPTPGKQAPQQQPTVLPATPSLGQITHEIAFWNLTIPEGDLHNITATRYLGQDDGGLHYVLVGNLPHRNKPAIMRFSNQPRSETKKWYGVLTSVEDEPVAFLELDSATAVPTGPGRLRDFLEGQKANFRGNTDGMLKPRWTSSQLQKTDLYQQIQRMMEQKTAPK